jgi:hypothetical protein
VPVEFFSTLLICVVLYPALRMTVFKPVVAFQAALGKS